MSGRSLYTSYEVVKRSGLLIYFVRNIFPPNGELYEDETSKQVGGHEDYDESAHDKNSLSVNRIID